MAELSYRLLRTDTDYVAYVFRERKDTSRRLSAALTLVLYIAGYLLLAMVDWKAALGVALVQLGISIDWRNP